MLSRPGPRFAIIGLMLLWVIYALMPTVQYRALTDEQKEARRIDGTLELLEHRIINLGLDLQGGIHLVLEVDLPALVRSLADGRDDRLDEVLSQTDAEVAATDAEFFDVFATQAAAANLRLIRYFSSQGTKLPEIIDGLRAEADDAVSRALEIIRNRVDQFGVSEPTIQKSGRRRIIVELAGIKDPEQARKLIQNTALLEFNLLQDISIAQEVMLKLDDVIKVGGGPTEELASAQDTIAGTTVSEDTGLEAVLGAGLDTAAAPQGLAISAAAISANPFTAYVHVHGNDLVVPARYRHAVENLLASPVVRANIPSDGAFLWSARTEQLPVHDGEQNFYQLYYVYREPGLTGGVITKARADIGALGSSSSSQPVVNVSMNNEGAKVWARMTGANVGRRVALVLDKKVHMAPVINSKIPNGATVIEGMDSMEEAKMIAIVLRAGSLPAPVSIVEERSVGPTMGQDSINMGVRAASIGGFLVIVFMLVYYRVSGLIATAALIFNILIVLAALASLRATLTLPGIAGLILTVGMAVDANVLIFERIREELEKGKSVRAAIDSGYARATVTIVDANVTTILAALVLFQFGSGPIKGFAITLFWGIAASMFTAIFMTRTIFMAITQRPKIKTLSI
ncbi:MAG: protein translocase subunit SecD [Candidatus Marinimicrobia bacterium]|nr:protein translocase subunit SecD [Candidatus Neomarinimicrobiota bacterium]